MSTHLGETINAVQNVFQTDNDDILDFRYPIRVQIESEQMDVSGAGFVGSEAIRWSVTRGVAGTTKAAHAVGTAITAVNASSGVGGGGVSVTVADADPGAIGAGNLWLRTDPDQAWPPTFNVRNADDDGWVDDDNSGYRPMVTVYDNQGRISGALYGYGSRIALVHLDPETGDFLSEVQVGDDGVHLDTNLGHLTISDTAFLISTTGGDALGFATGVLQVNGQPVGTRAAHVADGATVDQLRDALIASGLMAAS